MVRQRTLCRKKMPKVFISYSRNDLDSVQKLEEQLIARKVSVWRDQENIYGGQKWPKILGEAIASNNFVLLIWSRNSAKSHYVEFEWCTAIALKKEIVPWLLDDTPLPPSLSAINAVNAKSGEQAITQLVKTLRRRVAPPNQAQYAKVIEQLGHIKLKQPKAVTKAAKTIFEQHNWIVHGNVYQAGGDIHIAPQQKVQPPLSLPPYAHSSGRNRFHYGYEAVAFVGRHQEFSELLDFLSPNQNRLADFAWWRWTAPGGQGKSRLAFRLCMEMQSRGWRCGFLPPTSEFKQWEEWVVDQPTLMVIDHIAHRAKNIRQAICSLSRQTKHIRAPLRLLLLERPFRLEDNWVQEFVPQAFTEDIAALFEYAYDPTGQNLADELNDKRPLGPLGDDDLWQIVQAIVDEHGSPLPDRDTILALLTQIDPLRRPLFAILTAEALAMAGPDRIRRWNSSDLVRFILQREFSLWKETLHLADTNAGPDRHRKFEEHLNLVLFATITAVRQTPYVYQMLRKHSVPVPKRILPDWLRVMTGYSWEDTQEIIHPLGPDILGELFVLERLSGNFGIDANKQVPRTQTQRVLDVALAECGRTTIEFVKRCVDDFPEHVALERFTEIQIPEVTRPVMVL